MWVPLRLVFWTPLIPYISQPSTEEIAQIACDFANYPGNVKPIPVSEYHKPIPRRQHRAVSHHFAGYEAFDKYTILAAARVANMDKVKVEIRKIEDQEIKDMFQLPLPGFGCKEGKRIL